MAPGIVSHKGPQIFRRGHVASGGLFFIQQILILEGSCHTPDEGDAVHYRVEVLVGALFEGVEVDRRGIARIGGAQSDYASTIPGVTLQYYPSKIVEVFRKGLGISGTIPLKLGEKRHAEEVWRTFGDRRGPVDGEHATVRRIHAAAARVPLPILWVIGRKRC